MLKLRVQHSCHYNYSSSNSSNGNSVSDAVHGFNLKIESDYHEMEADVRDVTKIVKKSLSTFLRRARKYSCPDYFFCFFGEKNLN